MSENNKMKRTTLASLRKIKTGFMSRVIDEKMLAEFKKLELGGRIFFSLHTAEGDDGQPQEFGYLTMADKVSTDAYKTQNFNKQSLGKRYNNKQADSEESI